MSSIVVSGRAPALWDRVAIFHVFHFRKGQDASALLHLKQARSRVQGASLLSLHLLHSAAHGQVTCSLAADLLTGS